MGSACGGYIWILSPGIGALVAVTAVGMLEFVRRRTGVRRDYESIYSLGIAFAAFAGAEAVHGSGFLSAFAAGLTISALDVELCDCSWNMVRPRLKWRCSSPSFCSARR